VVELEFGFGGVSCRVEMRGPTWYVVESKRLKIDVDFDYEFGGEDGLVPNLIHVDDAQRCRSYQDQSMSYFYHPHLVQDDVPCPDPTSSPLDQ
jgi:hypothetical protein